MTVTTILPAAGSTFSIDGLFTPSRAAIARNAAVNGARQPWGR